MAAMQPSSSSRTISTPRPVRKARSPGISLGLADHHAGDLEEQDGAGAHLARGQRGVQGGVEVGGAPAGVAQAGDLAVRHRVTALHPLVVPGRDEVATRGEDRADRDAAAVQADPRLGQGERHHLAIGLVRLPVSHGGLRYLVACGNSAAYSASSAE